MANDDSFLGTLAAVDPADWGALGAGLLTAPTWQRGLATGMQGVQQGRSARAAAARQAELDRMQKSEFDLAQQTGKLNLEKIQKGLDTGTFLKVGPGVVLDRASREFLYADPAELEKLEAVGGSEKSPEHVPRPPVYDADGNLWFGSFNKSLGRHTWEGPGGIIRDTPPPGAARPSDSIYGEMGKIDKAFLTKMDDEYSKATEELLTAERSLQLLADPTVWTGFGAEIISDFKSAMITAGFASEETINSIAKIDEFRKLSFEFVMGQVAGTKGAVSDREMDLFAKASPGLSKTERGNQRILEGIRLMAKRKQEQHRFMNERMLGEGMPAWKAKEKWEDYTKENPIFTKDWFEVGMGEGVPTTAAPTGAGGLSEERKLHLRDKYGIDIK